MPVSSVSIEDFVPDWQFLLTQQVLFSEGWASVLQIHMAQVDNFLCLNTPLVQVFDFYQGAYVPLDAGVHTPPPVLFRVQGRYTAPGTYLTTQEVTARGENLEGKYFREYATNQYALDLLTGTGPEAVTLCMGDANTPKQYGNLSFSENAARQFIDALAGQWQTLMAEDDYHREGYVLVCAAWQFWDGQISSPGAPQLLHLGCHNVPDDMLAQGITFDPLSHIDVYYNRDKISFKRFEADNLSTTTDTACSFTAYVRRQWVQQLQFLRPASGLPSGPLVRKVVYFCSEPLSMYDFSRLSFPYLHTIYHYSVNSDGGLIVSQDGQRQWYRLPLCHTLSNQEGLPERIPTPDLLSGLRLYKAAEFDLNDAADTEPKTVNFSTLNTQDLLPATASGLTSFSCKGLLTYNRHLHLWNYQQQFAGLPVTDVSVPALSVGSTLAYTDAQPFSGVTQRNVVMAFTGGTSPYAKPCLQAPFIAPVFGWAIFRLNCNGVRLYHYRRLQLGINFVQPQKLPLLLFPPFLSFPDSRADQLTLLLPPSSTSGSDSWWQVQVAMHASQTADFSFCCNLSPVDSLTANVYSPYLFVPASGGTQPVDLALTSWLEGSPSVADGLTFSSLLVAGQPVPAVGTISTHGGVRVSALDNPCSWPASLAYRFDAPVSQLGVNHFEVSSSQTGQFPLLVFTNAGIWALGLGTQSLYGTQFPVSPLVSIGSQVLAIPQGLVFLSRQGVQLLGANRQISCLSRALSPGPDAQLLGADSVVIQLLRLTDARLSTGASYLLLPDGQPVSFSCLAGPDVAATALLGYDVAHNELWVTNSAVGAQVAFVCHLESGQWSLQSGAFYNFWGDTAVRVPPAGSSAALASLCSLSIEHWGTAASPLARPVCVLTSPFRLGSYAFKRLHQFYLRGLFATSSATLGQYVLLGSNNLQQWFIVSARQVASALPAQLSLPRPKWSYRYFALWVQADALSGFSLSQVQCGGNVVFDNRLR